MVVTEDSKYTLKRMEGLNERFEILAFNCYWKYDILEDDLNKEWDEMNIEEFMNLLEIVPKDLSYLYSVIHRYAKSKNFITD